METASVGSVLVCDVSAQQWRISSCDRQFSELSGACYNSLLGRNLHDILHPSPVLHEFADSCRLQQSTHWFAYAPSLPPVVMTTTLLPSEVVVRASSARTMVACHFSRQTLPSEQAQTNTKPSSIPCCPLFYDAAKYDKKMYVRSWSMMSCSSSVEPLTSPRTKDNLVVLTSRKPPLAPEPPQRRSMESASTHTTCVEGVFASQEKSSNRPQSAAGSAPSIPNEMGSRSLFLANMSHELRTPLNGTVAMVELLLGTNVSPEQRDLLKTVLESSHSLTRIVSSILDFAQLDSGLVALSRTPLNICDLVESCIDMVWPDALKKGLEVTVSAPRAAMTNMVLGDGLRIRQILVHLLSNAVKFTDQGSVEVEVVAEATATALNCELKVKDTGIGVPESFRPYLFDSFTQATESCTRTHGGLGLGLAICFNLARLMHADLDITNRKGGGSTATLSLCMPLDAGLASSSSTDLSSGSYTLSAEAKDGALRSPTYTSSMPSRSSTDSNRSSGGCNSVPEEKQTDASSVFASQGGGNGLMPFSKPVQSLHGTDTSIPELLVDPRIKLLQRHSAVIHTHSMAVSRQLHCACSALGMAVLDMPVMNSPQSLQEALRGKPHYEQLRGTPILFCNATDAAPALRNGWKKHPVVALCVDGRLQHALRVHVTPVAMPVKLRELVSAVLLALHGGPGKDSLLHVPLGTPKTVATAAGVACTAGFGGTACGFCTRCQRTTDAAAAAALHRHSLDNSALERFPQRLSVSATCLAAVVEGNGSGQSCTSCGSSESNWAATESSTLENSRSENSRSSLAAEGTAKADFVSSAGTESDTSGVAVHFTAAGNMLSPRRNVPQASKVSVESYKLPPDAVSCGSSRSPVRTGDTDKGVVGGIPQVSVCAATAMLGAMLGEQMQQQQEGVGAAPVVCEVPVLSAATAATCTPSAPAVSKRGMRRSFSANGLAQSSRPAMGDQLWPGQQYTAHPSGGVAMQSFLYRSAKQDPALHCTEGASAVADCSRGTSASQSEYATQRGPLCLIAQQSSVGNGLGQVARPPLPPAGASSKAGAKKLRLLVAEDNKINQLVVQKVVRKVCPACEIDVVENGEAALLSILDRPGYDLVLMDIHMPKMDGLETTRRVREKHPTRPMIVALTADTVVGMRQKCIQAGMQDYITKPFHVKDMQRILQAFLL